MSDEAGVPAGEEDGVAKSSVDGKENSDSRVENAAAMLLIVLSAEDAWVGDTGLDSAFALPFPSSVKPALGDPEEEAPAGTGIAATECAEGSTSEARI